jgi:hypothetical protein
MLLLHSHFRRDAPARCGACADERRIDDGGGVRTRSARPAASAGAGWSDVELESAGGTTIWNDGLDTYSPP